jgi:hypothetical protein
MQQNNISYTLCIFALILFALWQNGSCRVDKTVAMSKEQNRVAAGDWGGQNVRMNVTETGARLQFTCARGSIEEPLVLDNEGRFSAKGVFTADAMGPLRKDNPPKSGPALYNGTVSDTKMTLTITFIETKEKAGEYSLEYGKPGRVWRCH